MVNPAPRGLIVTPVHDPWIINGHGIPLYATSNLQYDAAAPHPIAWMHHRGVGWVMKSCRPRRTFTSVQVLMHSGLGWTSAAYIAPVST